MESLFAQIEAFAAQSDTAGRHKLLDLMHTLQLNMETPRDTFSRFSGIFRSLKFAVNAFPSGQSASLSRSTLRSPQLESPRT